MAENETTKIVRLTRHDVQPEQLSELKRLFGDDVVITTINVTMPTRTSEFVSAFDHLTADADVVEAVLPLTLLSAAIKFSKFAARGGKIIRAVMNRRVDGNNVSFEFDHYERIIDVYVVTEAL